MSKLKRKYPPNTAAWFAVKIGGLAKRELSAAAFLDGVDGLRSRHRLCHNVVACERHNERSRAMGYEHGVG